MPTPARTSRLLPFLSLLLAGCGTPALAAAPHASAARHVATLATLPALDTYGIVAHEPIVLERANTDARDAMPLGNGTLGAAVWSADGMTVQLNRSDTLPHRLSPGQLVLPGLAKLTHATDYRAKLDLATGEFTEQGAGMQVTVYIESATDALVVEVKGADPAADQTAELRLWSPRQPLVRVQEKTGVLAETWKDVGESGASGETFGSLAAVTAQGEGLRVEAAGPLAVRLHFHPHADGSYRVVVAAPAWRGGTPTAYGVATVRKAMLEPVAVHRDWWRRFWLQSTPLQLHSANGEADYLAQLRLIYLYTAAAETGSRYPGSSAGVGDLFSSVRDYRNWGPSAYWHWNLRMLTGANLGAGMPALNNTYFALYRENLPALLAWTRQHMGGRPGICIPETMRFNGKGYENESWIDTAPINCGEDQKPYYNARTISTGAEVALWIWRQYLATDNRDFLRANYPVMAEAARFLLAYSTRDRDGILHTFPGNAHETQWDVHDSTTDLLAAQALFTDTAAAAALLGRDEEFAARLREAAEHQPAWPLIKPEKKKELVPPLADGSAPVGTVIADSYEPAAPIHNVENIGLEAVWPYEYIGPLAGDPGHALGVRTFAARPQKAEADWSFDPVQAARLGLAAELRSTLIAITERYQVYPSGMADLTGDGEAGKAEFFVEQIAVLTMALQDALAQQALDGRVVVGAAIPAGWDGDGTVALEHGARMRVMVQGGQVRALAWTPGAAKQLVLENPWPGQKVVVRRAGHAASTLRASDVLTLPAAAQGANAAVLLEPSGADAELTALPFETATTPKRLGNRTIGIFAGDRSRWSDGAPKDDSKK